MKRINHAEKEKLLDFKKIGAIIEKNFLVLGRDRIRFVPLVLFPVFMILVFGYITGNTPKHISTAIIPYDNSPLSESIQQEIANSETFSVRYIVSNEGEGRKLLDSGKVLVLIEIPHNLQDDIDKGNQAGITVLVDESDSSVAATAKQTLNAIVDKVAAGISMQKIIGFQQSVGMAAQQMQAYAGQQIDQYDSIASKAVIAELSIARAKKITDNYADALLRSLSLPIVVNPTISNANDRIISANQTRLLTQPGYDSTKAQIAILQQVSSLMTAGGNNVKTLAGVAQTSDTIVKANQQLFDAQVTKPLQVIELFTHSKVASILSPLVYEEKPAYGTGKRPIDFIIASIIALTIFQGAVMGMGRAIAGEKREGSLTRVFLTPTSNATIIAGTLSFYAFFETVRSAFLIFISMLFFNIKIEGSILLIALIVVIYAGISTAIGMILSSAVKTEQQFMAMAMLVTMPTLFLSGVFFPLQAMPKVLQIIAAFLPISYAGQALRAVMIKGFSIGLIVYPLLILVVFLVLAIAAVFMVFKRDIE